MKIDYTTLENLQIAQLIDAFYQGETSVEQEQALFCYFESDQVDDLFLSEKELFLQMYRHTETIEVPKSIESKLNHLIDQLSEMEMKEKAFFHKRKNKGQLWYWISSAACIALLISAGFFLKYHQKSAIEGKDTTAQKMQLKDTFTDPERAVLEAEKALQLVSSKYNKGINQLALVSSSIKKTNEILNKTLKNS